MYRIFPPPKSISLYEGKIKLSSSISFAIDPLIKEHCLESNYDPESALKEIFTGKTKDAPLNITVKHIQCHSEGFYLMIDANGISINCNTGAGLFYGIQVIFQLVQQNSLSLPHLSIVDEPALSIRGIMLDVGRDKIPTIDTLKMLIDKLAAMRINHLQLYMEGFSFDYAEYKYLFSDETPITPGEFKELSLYANAHFIDLVPNQNVLGHMEKWLAKPQFRHLAECEDGYMFDNIYWRPPMTLDIQDEGSFNLACGLLDELLDNSLSDYVNVNIDEPFELGLGKNKSYVEQHGRLPLYLNYLEKLNTYCKSKGKRLLMWGDEILHNPEYISQFPRDVTLLDWIYEGDASFETHAKLMQSTGLDYCLCPGTSSWGSLTGRSENMAKNIQNATSCAIRYGAKGIIATDWGDLGHWQYISTSYPGFAHAAFYSWSGLGGDYSTIQWYCDYFIYQSFNESAYQTAWNLGDYYHLEYAPIYNTTLAFAVISSKYPFNSIEEFDEKIQRLLTLSANIAKTNNIPYKKPEININFNEMDKYLTKLDTAIQSISLNCEDNSLIIEEMKNGLRMVSHGIRLYHTMTELRDNEIAFMQEMKFLFNDLDEILRKHYYLWISRNRSGGFQRSTKHMNHLLSFYHSMSK